MDHYCWALGQIFGKAQNKFDSGHPKAMLTLWARCGHPISGGDCQDPAKLRRLIVDLIDKETWVSMSADVKGDAYEGLLEKNAQDTKSGAGRRGNQVPRGRGTGGPMANEGVMTRR